MITVVFFLFNVLPGDPARMMLDQRENSVQLQNIKKKYGFDKPLLTQYFYYLNDLSPISLHETKNKEHYTFSQKYDGVKLFFISNKVLMIKFPYLKKSFRKTGKKVTDIIAETFPNTFILAVSAIVISMISGLILGIVSAIYKGSILDKIISIIGALGMSLPSFFSAILIAWFFGFVLHKYTHLNMTGNLYTVDDFGSGEYLSIKNLILPAFTLGIRPLTVVIQLIRNSLLNTLSQDYIRTAKAKGLSFRRILLFHALKNSMNPVITAASGWFASMLAGAIFVEYIFGWNGIGKEIVEALNSLDMPVVMGIVTLISFIFIIINIVVDMLYMILDPKISKI